MLFNLTPKDDGVLSQVLKSAGVVIFAKTNIPQTLLTFETSNPVWGRCVNPWNAERTPGGSSGGEAALLAAGGSPLGIGTDVGGSVRIPCHFWYVYLSLFIYLSRFLTFLLLYQSGLYGLKATGTRISTAGTVSSVRGQEAVMAAFGM